MEFRLKVFLIAALVGTLTFLVGMFCMGIFSPTWSDGKYVWASVSFRALDNLSTALAWLGGAVGLVGLVAAAVRIYDPDKCYECERLESRLARLEDDLTGVR